MRTLVVLPATRSLVRRPHAHQNAYIGRIAGNSVPGCRPHAHQAHHPLSRRGPRPGGQGRQLPPTARRRRPRRGRPTLRRGRGRRTGLSRHQRQPRRPRHHARRGAPRGRRDFHAVHGRRRHPHPGRRHAAHPGRGRKSQHQLRRRQDARTGLGRVRQVRPLRHRRQHRPAPRPTGRQGSVGSPRQRRPHADRAGGRRLGAARRGAGGRRDRADLDGRRRHQGRLRPADDAGRRRGRRRSRRRQRRGRLARTPVPRPHRRPGRRRPRRQHLPLQRIRHRSHQNLSGRTRRGRPPGRDADASKTS